MAQINREINLRTTLLFAIFAGVIMIISAGRIFSQEDELDLLLNEEVENINPVYKPVIGVGIGVLNYFGDIRNNYYSPTL